MTFAILIDFLAHHFGPPLEDAGGASVLEVSGVQVILQEAGDLLLLRTEIGDLPEDDRAPLLAAILEANHLYRGTGGATLALVPGTSRLCLQKYTWLDRLSPDTIPDLLFRFSSTATTWHRLLADYRPAPPDDAPPPSPDFLQV